MFIDMNHGIDELMEVMTNISSLLAMVFSLGTV